MRAFCNTRGDFHMEKTAKFRKNEKNALRYHHFTIVYQKSWSYATLFLWKKRLEISSLYICAPKIMIRCTIPEIWCATDGRMDGQKKWHIEVGAPPTKISNVVDLLFCVWLYCYLKKDFTYCSGFSAAAFEQVDAGWVRGKKHWHRRLHNKWEWRLI